MIIEHIEAAVILKDRVGNNKKQIENISEWLHSYPNGNSNGKTVLGEGKLYSLHISQHSDRSGSNVNLSGSMIQTEVLQYAKELLQKQIEKDLASIESL